MSLHLCRIVPCFLSSLLEGDCSDFRLTLLAHITLTGYTGTEEKHTGFTGIDMDRLGCLDWKLFHSPSSVFPNLDDAIFIDHI